MKKLVIILCFFLSTLAVAQTHSVESIRDKKYRLAINRAEQYLDSLMKKQNIPGLSVSVGSAGKVLWAQGFGYADLENRTPVSIRSRFRMGSVSKSITSVAIGKLVQESKLDPDKSVSFYVPWFPAKRFEFSSRQLATHTAGVRHYSAGDPLSCPKKYGSIRESLAIFSGDSLLFAPGTSFNYSTYGYNVLAAVIEKASGYDYLSYMHKQVFLPLGMAGTCADYSDSIVPNRVRFYERSKTGIVNAALVDNSYKWAGGGLLSTPVDLVKMGLGLIEFTALEKQTVSMLFTPQKLSDATNTNYAFGWRTGQDKNGKRILHHGGLIDGGRTFLMLYPDDDLVIAIAANMSGANINVPDAETIANFFLK